MLTTHDRLPSNAFETESGEDLREWKTDRLLGLFATLEATGPAELNGEYLSALPADRDDEVRQWFSAVGSGHWIGKAYHPNPEGDSGEGYNVWRRGSGEKRDMRFSWDITSSTIVDGQSLVMRYASFKNRSGELELIDEVRRVRDGLYMGIYHTPMVVEPFTRKLRPDGQRTEAEVFFLAGPLGEWRGPDDPTVELPD